MEDMNPVTNKQLALAYSKITSKFIVFCEIVDLPEADHQRYWEECTRCLNGHIRDLCNNKNYIRLGPSIREVDDEDIVSALRETEDDRFHLFVSVFLDGKELDD